MHTFAGMANDLITLVKSNGEVFENIKASVQKNKIFIFDETLPIEENDRFYRKLPSGLVETFVIIDRGFRAKFHSIPGHFQCEVKREGNISNDKFQSIVNIYNATGPNSKININSVDNSAIIINERELFENIYKALNRISDTEIKNKALLLLEELEKSKKSPSFINTYKNFIGVLADHLSIITPFLPSLTHLIPS